MTGTDAITCAPNGSVYMDISKTTDPMALFREKLARLNQYLVYKIEYFRMNKSLFERCFVPPDISYNNTLNYFIYHIPFQSILLSLSMLFCYSAY